MIQKLCHSEDFGFRVAWQIIVTDFQQSHVVLRWQPLEETVKVNVE